MVVNPAAGEVLQFQIHLQLGEILLDDTTVGPDHLSENAASFTFSHDRKSLRSEATCVQILDLI